MDGTESVCTLVLDGEWTLSDFAAVLSRFDSLYLGLSALMDPELLPVIEDLVREYKRKYDRYPSMSEAPAWLRTAAGYRSGHARIQHIEMSSPAVLKFIGKLNPIESVRKIFRDKQRENTEREKAQLDYQAKLAHEKTERQKAELEYRTRMTDAAVAHSKVTADLAAKALENLGKLNDVEARRIAGQFLTSVLDEIDCDATYLARHEKIKQINVG